MGIVRPVMEVYPAAWIFFLIFILASTFTLLNLFIAVIVNAIQNEHPAAPNHGATDEAARLHHEIAELRSLLAETRSLLIEKGKVS